MIVSRRTRRLLTLTALALVAVLLVIARRLRPLDPLQSPPSTRLVLSVASPALRLLGAVDRRVSAWIESGLDLVTAHHRVRHLKAENAELRRQVAALNMALRRVGRWPALVAAAESLSLPTVAVEIFAVSPHRDQPTLIVDAGRAEGVQPGQPVIAPQGLVGRVTVATEHLAQVRLITADLMAVSALLASPEAPGIVRGLALPDRLEFVPDDQGLNIAIGTPVLTAGLEGSHFPAGLPIGEVREIGTTPRGVRRASVRPAVDFHRLSDLLVIIAPPPRLRPLEGRRLLGAGERAGVGGHERDVPPATGETRASPEFTAVASPEIAALNVSLEAAADPRAQPRTLAPSHDLAEAP